MRSTQSTIDVKPDRSKESTWCRWSFFEQPFPTHATAAIWRYEPTTTRRRYHAHAGHKANSIPQTSHVQRIWVTHSDLVQHIVWWRHLSMDHSASLLQGPSPFRLQPWQTHRLVYCSCSLCTFCTKGLAPEETAKDRAKNRANATDETISAACCSESDDCGPFSPYTKPISAFFHRWPHLIARESSRSSERRDPQCPFALPAE